jgi:HK97 family phage major capsid protein
MDLLKSKKLREQRAKLIADARKILETPELTAEHRSQHDKIMADADALMADITRFEKVETEERSLATSVETSEETDAAAETREKETRTKKYAAAFRKMLQFGDTELTPEERATLRQGEVRAQGIATNAAGAYTVPQGFMTELERASLQYGGVRQASRVIPTTTGNPLPWPTTDDTGNSGEDSTENVAVSDQDVVFGVKTLNAYKIDSGLVRVSSELFEDTGLSLEAEIGSIIGERLGRRQNTKFTTGSGVSTFQGCVIGASLGVTAASATAIAADELFDLFHKIDPSYRASKKCAWMMNDAIVKVIRKLKDSQNRYLWEASLQAGGPDTLMGKPVIMNQDMAAAVTTGQKTIMFGDFGKFVIRDVRSVAVRRLNERFAELDQVAFIAFYRGDSRLISASTKALSYLQQL